MQQEFFSNKIKREEHSAKYNLNININTTEKIVVPENPKNTMDFSI